MNTAQAPAIVRWSTDGVPVRQRFDYYADVLSSALTPMTVTGKSPPAFEAQTLMANLGPMAVFRQTGSGNCARRGAREIGRSGERSFHLLSNLASPWTLTHRGFGSFRPGDAVLTDSAFEFDLDLSAAYEVVHVKMSEGWLRQWIPIPAVLVGKRIPADSGWGRALTSFMAQLSPQFVVDSPLPTSVVADHVGALLTLLANEIAMPAGHTTRSGLSDLHRRIKDSIVQRCSESSLTAHDVAGQQNISVRTLHRSLAASGETFGALLISARAALAIRMLESPLLRRLTIAEIGRRAGFADASHMTRVIRSRAGRTPSQIRRSDVPQRKNKME